MKKIYLLVLVFLIVGGYMIQTNLNTDINDQGDRKDFVVAFVQWVYNIGLNIKDLAGHAVHQEWLPDTINQTNSTD